MNIYSNWFTFKSDFSLRSVDQLLQLPVLTNQSSQHEWAELLEDDGVTRLVPFKDLQIKTDLSLNSVDRNLKKEKKSGIPVERSIIRAKQTWSHDGLPYAAAAAAERLPSGRRPPARLEPPQSSSPSSELLSEPGSWPPGSEDGSRSTGEVNGSNYR